MNVWNLISEDYSRVERVLVMPGVLLLPLWME